MPAAPKGLESLCNNRLGLLLHHWSDLVGTELYKHGLYLTGISHDNGDTFSINTIGVILDHLAHANDMLIQSYSLYTFQA